ncbi:MAG: M6 family metalloprotease domain-containing protein [Prevotella sp.]|nr:M6 family metalloprotease domain-containing protein [Prevotella sp.]
MKKIFLSFIMLVTISLNATAAKADPEPQFIRQSDGTMLTVIAYGDENGVYETTTDGALLINIKGNYYIAGISTEGILTNSGLLAHDRLQRTAQEQEIIDRQNMSLFLKRFTTDVRSKKEPLPSGYFPHMGTPKALVVLVDFQDSTFKWQNEKAIFDSYLNDTSLDPELADGTLAKNYTSVAEYFNEMSFGQFRPRFDVVGPVRLPQKIGYYGANNDNVPALLQDALPLFKDSVNLKEYDADGDGYIDLLFFICASYSQSSNSSIPNLMWPKVTTVEYDTGCGVRTKKIGISCELIQKPTSHPSPHCAGIGLFCHEFSHAMGMPDLYSTSSVARMLNQTYEYWDIMDGGEYTKNGLYPNAYSAWERECMGWMKIDTLKEACDITLLPLSDKGGKAYRIFPEGEKNGTHYYIIENVQKKGCNASALGHGLLVYDITYNGHSMTPNDRYTTEGNFQKSATAMTLVPADGFVAISFQKDKTIYDGETPTTYNTTEYMNHHASDPYPGTLGVTEVRSESKDIMYDKTNNRYIYSTKNGYLGRPLTDIQEHEDGKITLKYDGGTPSAILSHRISETNDGATYNLLGQRVTTVKRHTIIIRNGKKILNY